MTERDDFVAAAGEDPARKAPYTFIDNGRRILPSPTKALDLSRPVERAVSGRITVRWTAKTPLLTGGGNAMDIAADRREQDNLPLRIGEGEYAIAGSSLKGLIRSVLEIVTFARLSFIDDFTGHTHDYDDATWKGCVSWKMTKDRHKGGWLFRTEDGFKLVEAQETEPIRLSDFLPLLDMEENKWHASNLERRLEIIKGRMDGLRNSADFGSSVKGRARLVMSGPTPSELIDVPHPKNREYLFFWPDSGSPSAQLIDEGVGNRFLASLRDKDKAGGSNYCALTACGHIDGFEEKEPKPLDVQLENLGRYGLPVFWRNPGGASQDKCGRTPILSLTALFRVPYDKSVSDLVKKSQDPLPETEYDFVQALLGWAPTETPDSEFPAGRNAMETPLRSRVKFGFATSGNAEPESKPRTWAATRPRPSYWPYYLKHSDPKAVHPVDYNNPSAVLAGRKRYPARNNAGTLPRGGKGQDGQARDAMESNVHFLKPGAEFTSDIRVHNVTPVELGALIWAITFGDPEGGSGYFHMLGRAKSHGYGQLEARIIETDLRFDQAAGCITPQEALEEFSDWMKQPEQMGAVPEDLEPVRRLLATAHADTGAGLAECLQWPRAGNGSEGEQVLNAYGNLKRIAQTSKNGGKAGKTVEKTGPLCLPPYPRQGSE